MPVLYGYWSPCPRSGPQQTFSSRLFEFVWVHGVEPDENELQRMHAILPAHTALTSLSAVELTSIGHCPVASTPDDASLDFSLYRNRLCLEFGLFDYLRTELYGGFGKSCKFS